MWPRMPAACWASKPHRRVWANPSQWQANSSGDGDAEEADSTAWLLMRCHSERKWLTMQPSAVQVLPVASRKALAAKVSVGGTLPGGAPTGSCFTWHTSAVSPMDSLATILLFPYPHRPGYALLLETTSSMVDADSCVVTHFC